MGRKPVPLIRLIHLMLLFFWLQSAAAASPEVRIVTNLGTVDVRLFQEAAPLTVAHFLRLVDEDAYDNTIFHRVVVGFMVQGGGYQTDLARQEDHRTVKNEAGNGLKNRRGTLAMARFDTIDSASRQFFINVDDNTHLDHSEESCTREDERKQQRAAERGLYKPMTCRTYGYAVFGEVIRGMEIVDEIELVDVEPQAGFEDLPVHAVVIRDMVRLSNQIR